MRTEPTNIKNLTLCAIAVCINATLGSIITYLHVPLLYLDSLGTIFIAVTFKMRYGILTGLCTNLLLAVIHGPLAIPFSLVSITVAIIANLCAKKEFTYKKAIITGILLASIGSLVSAPIRLILFGGFGGLSKSITDILVFSIQASGREIITAAYWGALVDSLFDKIISCLLIAKLIKFPPLQKRIVPLQQIKGNLYEQSK